MVNEHILIIINSCCMDIMKFIKYLIRDVDPVEIQLYV